ncbi:MAG: thioredoxin family protein [Pseudomonadota bacterium]
MSPPSNTGPLARSYTLVAATVFLAAMAVAGAAAYALIQRAPASDAQSGAADGDAVQQALRLGKPVVAEFGANSCESCREMKLVLGALAREHGERVTVVDIDLPKAMVYASRYKIQLIPTQVFFDAQGREIGRHMGKISGNEILARLNVSPSGRVP